MSHRGTPGLDPSHRLYLAPDAGVAARAKVALRAVWVLTKDQADGIAAPVLNVSMDAEVFAKIAAECARTPEGQALLREKPDLQASTLDLPAMRALPEGTLGKQLVHYYEDNGIQPFESPYPASDDVEYLAKRYRELHDVVHVVTGYGTDGLGEMELQAFIWGNLGLRNTLLNVGLTSLLPSGARTVWLHTRELRAAYERGRQSQDVCIKPRYEHLWASSVEDVRQQIGLAPRDSVTH
jgi:ubiquinone biosynthesis protein COQ4